VFSDLLLFLMSTIKVDLDCRKYTEPEYIFVPWCWLYMVRIKLCTNDNYACLANWDNFYYGISLIREQDFEANLPFPKCKEFSFHICKVVERMSKVMWGSCWKGRIVSGNSMCAFCWFGHYTMVPCCDWRSNSGSTEC
jgi:hypothetical protein